MLDGTKSGYNGGSQPLKKWQTYLQIKIVRVTVTQWSVLINQFTCFNPDSSSSDHSWGIHKWWWNIYKMRSIIIFYAGILLYNCCFYYYYYYCNTASILRYTLLLQYFMLSMQFKCGFLHHLCTVEESIYDCIFGMNNFVIFCYPILFAICTSLFNKLCIKRIQWDVEECSVALLCK
jgi:hypothetical protein